MVRHEKLFAAINPAKEDENSEFKRIVDRVEASSELIKLCGNEPNLNDYIINKILKNGFDFEVLSALLKVPKSKTLHETLFQNLLEASGNDLSKIFFALRRTEPNSVIRRQIRYAFLREAAVKEEKTPKDWEVLYIYYLPDTNDERFVLEKIAKMEPKERNLIINNILAFNDWESIFMGSDGNLLALEKILKICQKALPEAQAKSLINQKIKQSGLSFKELTKMAGEANSGLKEALLKVAYEYSRTPEERKIVSTLKRVQ